MRERVVGANPPPMLLWEGVVGERLLDRHFHQLGGAAQAKATQLLVVEGTWLKILRYQCTMGSLKKFGRTDSVIASDSRSAGAGHAGTQGAGSTGAAHHWLATTAHS